MYNYKKNEDSDISKDGEFYKELHTDVEGLLSAHGARYLLPPNVKDLKYEMTSHMLYVEYSLQDGGLSSSNVLLYNALQYDDWLIVKNDVFVQGSKCILHGKKPLQEVFISTFCNDSSVTICIYLDLLKSG